VRYVLDTNVVSAFMKGNAAVRARIAKVSQSEIGIPQPVLAEIAYGIDLLPECQRKRLLEERFELVRAQFLRVVWSDDVTNAYGHIKASLDRRGQRIEDFDAAIAAHAIAINAVMVSVNRKHMARIPGIRLEDWSQE
jgi:tRNA(fMet)-specific endonuclease VapC